MDGVAKPFVPKVSYRLSPNGTMHKTVLAPPTPGQNGDSGSQGPRSQPPGNKHTITISPGQSPVKKKSKAPKAPKAQKVPSPPKAKKPHNSFMIWSMVERRKLAEENPGIQRSKYLHAAFLLVPKTAFLIR